MTCRIPDPIDIKRRVDYQRAVENVTPDVASVRNLGRVSRKGKEPFRWVLDVGGHIVGVIAGSRCLIEVLEICLAGVRLDVR